VLARDIPNAKARGLCVGFDGRRKSRELASVTAEVASGAGFTVHLFDDVVPTPLLAFSITQRGAAAGVMITASHNPPEYNGYKAYWENGAQIVPPQDVEIAQAIAAVSGVRKLPRNTANVAGQPGVERRYVEAVRELIGEEVTPSPLRIVYTALHGVGERLATELLRGAGFPHVHSVPEQAEPDGTFPTVKFPNPEEPGAMDLALALANETSANLVLANDPDADRLAVAVRSLRGEIVQLTGNETGLLLADHLLARAPRDGKNLVLASLVSTPLIARLAASYGARCEFTLTGFKWIANRAIELTQRDGLRFLLGFEEALGFSVGNLVRDKDGVSAALLAARIAAHHAREGRTLLDALEAIYRKHGLYESRPISITLPGATGMATMLAAMNALRAAPPRELAGCAVNELQDLERSVDLPPSNVLVFQLAGGHRICVRPSGTEPKLKIYVDACTEVAVTETLSAARTRARELADSLGQALRTHAKL
jgi:phosphomannomutase